MKKFNFLLIFLIYFFNLFSNIELKPWEDWWQNNFDVNLFNSYWSDSNNQSRQIIREIVDKLGYKSILDVGSGTGTDFQAFKTEKIDVDYYAIDLTPKLVEHCKSLGLNIQQASVENIPFENNKFDLVYCRHLIEHLSDYELAINELIRVSKSEVAIVFFIKPSEQPDYIDLIDVSGSLLFHNRYNKQKLENYILSNPKVKHVSWQDLNDQETILHIYLDFDLLSLNNNEHVLNYVKKYLPGNPIILEAGAYDGSDTKKMKNFWPKSEIHTFEPVPYIYHLLTFNTRNLTSVYKYNIALSDKIGIAKFNLSEDPSRPGIPTTSGSLLPAKEHLKRHFYTFNNWINVSTTTLDQWAQKNNIKHIDFVWLDTQGSELPILKNGVEILKTVKVIFIEAEFIEAYKDQSLYKELKTWLESQGFKAIARDICYPSFKHWSCNVIFIKN